MTSREYILEVLEEMEANPEIAARMDGLPLPDKIMIAEALINCGEWPKECEETEFGYPKVISWGVSGIY